MFVANNIIPSGHPVVLLVKKINLARYMYGVSCVLVPFCCYNRTPFEGVNGLKGTARPT